MNTNTLDIDEYIAGLDVPEIIELIEKLLSELLIRFMRVSK